MFDRYEVKKVEVAMNSSTMVTMSRQVTSAKPTHVPTRPDPSEARGRLLPCRRLAAGEYDGMVAVLRAWSVRVR